MLNVIMGLLSPRVSLRFKGVIIVHLFKKLLFALFPKIFAYDYFGRIILYPNYLTPIVEDDLSLESLIEVQGFNKQSKIIQINLKEDLINAFDTNTIFQTAMFKAFEQGVAPKLIDGQLTYDIIGGVGERYTMQYKGAMGVDILYANHR